jgi:hypothetical protein
MGEVKVVVWPEPSTGLVLLEVYKFGQHILGIRRGFHLQFEPGL